MAIPAPHRPLLLNGFMATGKSTVGRELSRDVGVDFIDLDTRIEQRAGLSVAEIFAQNGEATFRRFERAALLQILEEGAAVVVALGGGALLHSETRLIALERAIVVSLHASPEEILKRSSSDSQRPLLQGIDESHLHTLLETRRAAYAEAHALIDTTGRSPRQVAEEAARVWKLDAIAVAAKEQSYVVEIGRGFAPESVARQLTTAPMVLLVSDTTVDSLYGGGYRNALARHGVNHFSHALSPGEEHKTPASLQDIWHAALAHGADRGLQVVGLGGGVVTDVAGFAAATWMRGVSWLSVPTTLLGMVDASVGGKTAVDLPLAKNCVGAFWQPRRVFCDIDQLKSEPRRGYISALSEVVKTALLGDAPLFDLLEREQSGLKSFDLDLIEELVRRCIRVKASVVSRDAREGGLRAALNLGHTVGHAIESVGGFGRHTHGEAISLGLIAALRIGVALGVTPKELEARVVRLLRELGLPTALEDEPLDEAAKLLGHDKKRGGDTVKFVLCPQPGQIVFERLPIPRLQTLTRALARST